MLLDERVRRRRDRRALTARWITLVSAAAALLPAETAAQGRISGSVVDSDGEPLAYALIRLRDGAEVASTDEQGRFALDGVPVGVTWIAGVGPGCTAAVDSVIVRDGDEVVARLTMPTSAAEAGTESAVGMSRAELISRNFRSVYEALRAIAPYMVSHLTGEVGGDRYVSNRAGRTFSSNEPVVTLDGIRLMQVSVAALEDIPIEDLERIEVARGASAGWRYGIGSAGGVIVLTTTRSGQPVTPPDLASCDVPFPPWT